jgi:hypothetical protein
MRSLEVEVRTGLRKSGLGSGAGSAGRVRAAVRRGNRARRKVAGYFMVVVGACAVLSFA